MVVILVVLTTSEFKFSLCISLLLAKAIPVRGAKFKKPAFEQAFCFSVFMRPYAVYGVIAARQIGQPVRRENRFPAACYKKPAKAGRYSHSPNDAGSVAHSDARTAQRCQPD